MLTAEEALSVAEQELVKAGHALADYSAKVETSPLDPNDWVVWFDKKGPFPSPGGKHAVTVSKATGQATFMHGE